MSKEMEKYKDMQPYVYEVSYALIDPDSGEPVTKDNGEVKLFHDPHGNVDTSTWAEWVEVEQLEEVEQEELCPSEIHLQSCDNDGYCNSCGEQ